MLKFPNTRHRALLLPLLVVAVSAVPDQQAALGWDLGLKLNF